MPPAWMFSQPADDVVEDVDDVTTGMNSDHDDENQNTKNSNSDEEVDAESAYPVKGNPSGVNSMATNPTPGLEVVRQGSGFETVNSEIIPKDGFYISKPYKREIIAQQLTDNSPGSNRRMAIIGALRDLGVKVFIIEAKSIQTTADILHHVRRVVGFVARENHHARHQEPVQEEDFMSEVSMTSTLGFQRCLLYQDKIGRLFNLTLSPHAVGPAAKFEDFLDSFSALQALVALTIMCRSFCCLMTGSAINGVKVGFLTLILGLILTEEMSLSWLNASMLVRASPSVAAHSLTSNIATDIFRKAVLLCLSLAGACEGNLRETLTAMGISGACLLLLSNLGSRAWHFMSWKPLAYQGPCATGLSWLVSILTGIAFPFMAHRKIHVGGLAALEYVITTAVTVGLVFVVSGIDEVRKFSIVSNDACDQDYTNILVGAWWFLSFVASMLMVYLKLPYNDQSSVSAADSEPLLLKDHSSPVGFKVPSLPDYEMDPSLAWTGKLWCFKPIFILVGGLISAVVVGGGIMYLGFESWDEDAVDKIEGSLGDLFR